MRLSFTCNHNSGIIFCRLCAMFGKKIKCISDRLICFRFHFLRFRPASRAAAAGHKSSWLQSRIHRPPRPTRSIRRYVMRPIARAIVGGPRTDSPAAAAAAANRLWGPPRGNLICRPVVEGVEVAGQCLMLSSFLRSLSAKVV